MQLIDIKTIQGRVNSILLLMESPRCEPLSVGAKDVFNAVKELAHGLDFYAETPRPERSSNATRKPKHRRKAKRK
jgi:hypothetical protein